MTNTDDAPELVTLQIMTDLATAKQKEANLIITGGSNKIIFQGGYIYK